MNMINKSTIILIVSCLLTHVVLAQNKPFPQAVTWPGCIKPNHVTQATLNSDVAAYYNYWKSAHLRQSTVNSQRYYVRANSTGGSAEAITNSEAHGYGMLITVLMAGYDANAKTYYDGLYRMYDTHRSVNNNNLMQWQVFPDENSRNIGSATDGDMDIAYSLLLAHYQWGSTGTINYLDAAKKMITNGLKASYISSALRLRLSDDAGNDIYSTRPSDWMFDHIHAFKNHTGETIWDDLANNLYSVYNQIITNYSSATGLISDFVMYSTPQPAPPYQPQEDEGPTTGKYYYNACRVPLRVVMDYAQYSTNNAKTIANKIVTWSKNATGGNPANIRAGYNLDGTPLSGSNYQTAVFIAPIVAAATCDASHQQFLNSGWNTIRNMQEGYFEDTYNMLCMLYISGNWWKPVQSGPTNTPPVVSITAPANNATFATGASVNITANASDSDGTVSKVEFYAGTTKLGEDTSAPYSYTWSGATAGSYSLTGKATDNTGAVTTSAAIAITIGSAACEPVTASANDGNIPANVLDNNLATRWSAEGDGQWIQFCLGNTASVTGVQIAFYSGNVRTSTFDVLVSTDGNAWTAAATGQVSSGTSLALQTFSFTAKTGKYVRIVGHGNSVNLWNSYTEVKINVQTTAVVPIGQTVWLRGVNNQYVSSKNGEGPMWCNATAIQNWNQFLVVDAGGGKVALQNVGKYISSENGEQAITCNRPAVQDWEKFDWITNSDGTISLRGNNTFYISSENGAQAMTCTRPAIDAWEKFTYGIVSGTARAASATAEESVSLRVYPNPVEDQFSYTIPAGATQHAVVVKNAQGITVLEQRNNSTARSIDVSGWKTGIYYITISGAGFSSTFQVVRK
ncbi:MAG TPA: glycosyl hydrolase family 8 [Ohtaekwangia sp.]|uniref:glycosyl hydrolase family 8 n=1 Tax=Ohtaekwangia sp. TaxID=2066019 RepID=UPI002F956F37